MHVVGRTHNACAHTRHSISVEGRTRYYCSHVLWLFNPNRFVRATKTDILPDWYGTGPFARQKCVANNRLIISIIN